MSNFYRWFADESAKLARYMRAKKRAESRENEVWERIQNERRGKRPPESDSRRTVQLAFSLRVLELALTRKVAEESVRVERRFMTNIVDTQRELLVQAWHVHVARAIKRVGNDLESYTVRKTWRELAGAYAILCLVDGFDIVRENCDIGFMLSMLDKEDRHGF